MPSAWDISESRDSVHRPLQGRVVSDVSESHDSVTTGSVYLRPIASARSAATVTVTTPAMIMLSAPAVTVTHPEPAGQPDVARQREAVIWFLTLAVAGGWFGSLIGHPVLGTLLGMVAAHQPNVWE